MEQNRKARIDPHTYEKNGFQEGKNNSMENGTFLKNATVVSWYPFGKKLTSHQIQKSTWKYKTQSHKASKRKHNISLWLMYTKVS